MKRLEEKEAMKKWRPNVENKKPKQKKVKAIKKKTQNNEIPEDEQEDDSQIGLDKSSSLSDTEFTYHSDTSGDLNLDLPVAETIKPSYENIKVGAYALIELVGGRRNSSHYRYACIIQHIDDDEIRVNSLKRCDEYATEFCYGDNDVFTVEQNKIKRNFTRAPNGRKK